MTGGMMNRVVHDSAAVELSRIGRLPKISRQGPAATYSAYGVAFLGAGVHCR
jgi:hypothetical protein